MWSAIGRMLDRDDVEAGIPEMCAALDHLYYDSKDVYKRQVMNWLYKAPSGI